MDQQLPFKTQDAILAFCLYIAGVPEWCTPLNIYDADILKRLGYRGMTLEDAAREAMRREQRGTVEYWFERTPELPHFLKSYEDQQAKIKEQGNDIDAGVSMRDLMRRAAGRADESGQVSDVVDEREALLRFFCVALKLRIPFVNRWKTLTPFIRVIDDTPARATGPNSTRFPGLKLIPLKIDGNKH